MKFSSPSEEDFPRLICKNASWLFIQKDLTPYVERVLSAMNLIIDQSPSAKRTYRFVDVKVHHLEAGQETANGFWHLDSSLNPIHEYDNLLFVSGSLALTEFVTNPIEIEHQERAISFHRAIEAQKIEIERIPSCTIVRYNGSNVHRGPKALGQEKRLLIRMVTTDHFLPGKSLKFLE